MSNCPKVFVFLFAFSGMSHSGRKPLAAHLMPAVYFGVSRVAREGRTTYILLLSIAFLDPVCLFSINRLERANDKRATRFL
jgi:hypothetical protein